MLWFDKYTLWIRCSRNTEIKLTFQVSALFFQSRWKVSVPELASWQRAHAGPPPGDIIQYVYMMLEKVDLLCLSK